MGLRLHNLKPAEGSKKRRKRLGRGEASGKGKTSGKGHKGQKARSGGGIRIGFEGGQMPLYRRVPKRGFNNDRFKTVYGIVNLETLEKAFEAGTTVNEKILRDQGILKGPLRRRENPWPGRSDKEFCIGSRSHQRDRAGEDRKGGRKYFACRGRESERITRMRSGIEGDVGLIRRSLWSGDPKPLPDFPKAS